jgi:hypothetical protein
VKTYKESSRAKERTHRKLIMTVSQRRIPSHGRNSSRAGMRFRAGAIDQPGPFQRPQRDILQSLRDVTRNFRPFSRTREFVRVRDAASPRSTSRAQT